MRFPFFFLPMILGFWGCTEPSISSQPTDSEIKSVLEAEWKNSLAEVQVGNFAVIGGNLLTPDASTSKGTISAGHYKDLLAWEKVGLITIRRDQQYENFRKGRSFSWDQWDELTQKHVQMKIVVTPTERGRQYLQSGSPNLKVPWGKFWITKIVKNEERKIGVDMYRLVMVSYDATLNPDYKAFWEVIGVRLDEKRKAILLMKFDPFASKWNTYTGDVANANEEFKSNNVARALAKSD